jgi:gas vesicle protein
MKKIGLFFGLVFGAVVGLLFAPRKGKELRSKIKDDRKKGNLGISPLKEDLTDIGRTLAALAKDFYDSPGVQDIVELGRKKVKDLSNEFVGEVNDFHYNKIEPMKDEVKTKVNFVKNGIEEGKDTFKKVKASVKIGKRAVKDIKREFKKK